MGMGMMLCGGSPSVVTPLGWGGFVACMALSERNNNPTKYAHPWESSNAMTEDMNEEADAEEFTFVLTDEWKDKAASKKDGYTLGEPSMYERKTDKLVGQDNFDTNAISDKPVKSEAENGDRFSEEVVIYCLRVRFSFAYSLSHGGTMTMSLMHQWHDTICGGVIGPRRSLLERMDAS
ncbi:hypothetical protein Tco_1561350 [Tanacetum coccineum]